MPRLARPTLLILAVLLAACTQGPAFRDLEGHRLGQLDWQPITANEARISIMDDRVPVLSRENVELDSRYMERWSLDGGHLVYEALVGGGFGSESESPAYLSRLYGNDPALRQQGVRFEDDEVRKRGDLTFVVARSDRVTCFVFVSIFGETTIAESPGNQLLRGGICHLINTDDPADDDLDFFEILENLHVNDKPVLRD